MLQGGDGFPNEVPFGGSAVLQSQGYCAAVYLQDVILSDWLAADSNSVAAGIIDHAINNKTYGGGSVDRKRPQWG